MDSRFETHPLAIAARMNDAQAEEIGLEKLVQANGLHLGDLVYIAEQRAVRFRLIDTDRAEQLIEVGMPVPFSQEDVLAIQMVTPAYMDGIMIGWKARDIDPHF